MKKFLCTLLVLLLVGSLAACGEKNPDGTGDTPSGSQSGSTPVVDPVTSPVKDGWGKEADVSTSNAEYKCAQYFISYPYYVGVKKLTGYAADQGDGTLIVIDSQLAGETVPESVKEVFPLWFEKTSKVLGAYIGSRGANYEFELKRQKAATINGKEMVEFSGNLTYTYKMEPQSSQWVAYATQVEENGAYTCWMVLDISDDQSKGNLIEEHALNMAKSFREE